jgi:putative addiction module killer protein
MLRCSADAYDHIRIAERLYLTVSAAQTPCWQPIEPEPAHAAWVATRVPTAAASSLSAVGDRTREGQYRRSAAAAAKVAAALYQLAAGNFSNVQAVGSGVLERRIDFGPGFRVYFGREGNALVILLGGSSKQRQSQAIAAAKERWAEYRRRRR